MTRCFTALLLSTTALFCCHCTDFEILRNTVPDKDCNPSVNPANFLPRGLLDLNHPIFEAQPVYYMHPQVANANGIRLKEAVISYEWLVGRESLATYGLGVLLGLEEGEFSVPLSGNLQPVPGSTTSVVPFVEVIPPNVGTHLSMLYMDAKEFTLGIHLRLKGESEESNTFLYPLDFCWGCLDEVCCPGENEYYPSCYPGQDINNLLPCQCPCS